MPGPTPGVRRLPPGPPQDVRPGGGRLRRQQRFISGSSGGGAAVHRRGGGARGGVPDGGGHGDGSGGVVAAETGGGEQRVRLPTEESPGETQGAVHPQGPAAQGRHHLRDLTSLTPSLLFYVVVGRVFLCAT